jgi:hypothetical protein
MAAESGFSAEEALFVPGGGKDQVPIALEALDSLSVQSYGLLDFDTLYEPAFMKRLAESRGIPAERLLQCSRAIRSQLPTKAMRDQAKKTGLRGLPAGDCATMAKEMIGILALHRVMIVDVGELESFDNTIGRHASAWVSEALARNVHTTSDEAAAVLAPLVSVLASR